MLSRLRHDTFVRRDNKHNQIHSDYTCYHVVDEALMSRNINNSRTVPVWKIKVCKAQINSDASSLFFLPSVCISSCQCLNQRRLAMVNMTGRSYNNVFHAFHSHCLYRNL